MKIFRSESFVDYSTYTFNYAIYCLKESQNELPEIYDKGFLPYSNNIELKQETYYLARSLRVDLSNFKETSENRRVLRKIEVKTPNFILRPVEKFDLLNNDFQSFCLDFASNRFSENISRERLNYILKTKSISHIFEFLLDHKKVGYVIAIIENGMLHYWFAFFDLSFQEYSLGKYMMFSVINWARENNLKYVYLGTSYGEKSLYKVRDFKGLEFFDGNQWNNNMKILKNKCKKDKSFTLDYFKQDTDLFLENLSY
ncbi:MAG: GNAT family N-acetyltransferase [Bacteroidota bacterium]